MAPFGLLSTPLKRIELLHGMNEDYEVTALLNNPTMNQIKRHNERTTGKAKAKACFYASISPTIFNRIMAFGSAKEICLLTQD
ncbi:UBN2 domain-containing protein [Gossypium australe]|uniref:UBN2 domain-containing protein n=1 Tax=Gossypium australe TaxID=47621 RepID=A0A5B6VEN6_9ROSI|nr:UBN2 domain-containing protein [Gossypium australe]